MHKASIDDGIESRRRHEGEEEATNGSVRRLTEASNEQHEDRRDNLRYQIKLYPNKSMSVPRSRLVFVA